MRFAREAGLFAIGGVIGFVVDAGIVQWLVRMLGWNPYLARIPSFLLAASVTWWWNRNIGFAHRRGDDARREWLRWMAVMGVGAAINYGIYALLLGLFATVRSWPVLGVATGSCIAAMVNFMGARRVVFRKLN